MRNRRIILGLVAALALIVVTPHPSAKITVNLHDVTDRAPHQVKAAIDLGLVAVSVLVTWTDKHL